MNERLNTKGETTKNAIHTAAAELFFEHGYDGTTLRQISELSGANVGLVKYYFGGKADVALEIYRDLRVGFEALVDADDYRPGTPDMFLLSSAIELYACLESPEYGRFFYEFSGEPKARRRIEGKIADALMTYAGARDNYVALACASLTAIKPAIVGYSLHSEDKIPTEEYLLYYLRQQIHFLGEAPEYAERLPDILRGYYIAVAKRFTPVMVKLKPTSNTIF